MQGIENQPYPNRHYLRLCNSCMDPNEGHNELAQSYALAAQELEEPKQ